MRIGQKKQAEAFIQLLEDVHSEIKKAIDYGNMEKAMILLEQCQDGAIKLGTMIEAVEDKGVATVGLLEKYCDLTYQIYEEITKNVSVSSNKIYKNLKKMLILIWNSLKKDIPVRIEAVFLPYKASMWDSLESVWKAANEDPICDAYVIPIPYYDKKPDGSLGEEHYEGDLYPDYVPITWYQAFDFSVHRPEYIFIHNPYDEVNYVTSVHPLFYSDKLKSYTENLVYIPYYILQEVSRDNQAILKEIEPYCIVPGVINADKVIVQSEAMRQIYIDILTRHVNQYRRSDWGKKILGLGSPKIDKVFNTKREKLEMPGEWMQTLHKQNGSLKKVVLYNTSINALLKHGEKMLKKIEDVFYLFEQYSENVTLLWRPHPLIKRTIESMCPQFIEKYQALLDMFQRDGNGIYDDTPDLHRAISISDAYIGDSSSLVALYQETGKPIMLQNADVRYRNQENLICPIIVFEDKNYLWMSETTFGAMYCYNKKNTRIEKTFVFESAADTKGYYYCRGVEVNNKIYFSPLCSREIGVYNKNTDDFSYIPFDESYEGMAFGSAFYYGEFVYFMPMQYPGIMRLNTSTLEISFFTDWVEQINNLNKDSNTDFLCSIGVQINEDTIAAASARANAVITFNMRTEQSRVYEVGEKEWRYMDICFDGISFWLLPRFNNPVVRWNPLTNEITAYSQFICDLEHGKPWFGHIEYLDGRIWILPKCADFAITIDVIQEKMRKADEIEDIFGFHSWGSTKEMCVTSWVNDSVLYLFDAKRSALVHIDSAAVYKEKILPPNDKIWLDRYYSTYKKLMHEGIVAAANRIKKYRHEHMTVSEINSIHKSVKMEQEKFNLSLFIELEILQWGNKNILEGTDYDAIGEKIYSYLKSQLLGERL